jgi:transposase
MEATRIYSMPVYHALIEHGQFEKVLVCNAGHVRNVPGRKTDLSDAEWLVALLECGLLRGSFIAPAQIKAARDVIRYRTKLTESRTSELQRLGNVLQDAGIKVDSVASRISTLSVRAMVEALIDGERRTLILADLAKGKMRAKIPDLQRALEGRFDDHHPLMCRLHLDHLEGDDRAARYSDRGHDAALSDPTRTVDYDPWRRPLRRRSHHFRGRGRHRRDVPLSRTFRVMDRTVPRQPRIRRQTPLRQTPKRQPAPATRARRMRMGRTPGYLQNLYRWHVRKFGGSRSPTAKNKAAVAVAHKLSVIIWHITSNRPRKRNPKTHRQTPSPRTHRHHRNRFLTPQIHTTTN